MKRRPRGPTARTAFAAALASCFAAGAASAQLPTSSASYLGAGRNGIALARGWESAALNPANLGLASSPRFSLSLLGTSVLDGLHPVDFLDLSGFAGERVPDTTKDTWLSLIELAGRQAGSGGVEVSMLSMSIGPLAVQASSVGVAHASLNPDGAEILFFGNSGRTGAPRSLVPTDARFDLFAYSTVAVSFGFRIIPDGVLPFGEGSRLSLGATLKYTFGHQVVVARDAGSSAAGSPAGANILLPTVQTPRYAGLLDSGGGPGLDVGLAWEAGRVVLSLAGRNVVNLFGWDVDRLVYRPNRLQLSATQSQSVLGEVSIDLAPAALVQIVEDLEFAPELAVGLGYRPFDRLQIMADFQHRIGDGMAVTPRRHLGGGVEISPPVPLIKALRAGAAAVNGGYQAGGGVTIGWREVSLSGAYLHRDGEALRGALASVSLSIGGR